MSQLKGKEEEIGYGYTVRVKECVRAVMCFFASYKILFYVHARAVVIGRK